MSERKPGNSLPHREREADEKESCNTGIGSKYGIYRL